MTKQNNPANVIGQVAGLGAAAGAVVGWIGPHMGGTGTLMESFSSAMTGAPQGAAMFLATAATAGLSFLAGRKLCDVFGAKADSMLGFIMPPVAAIGTAMATLTLGGAVATGAPIINEGLAQTFALAVAPFAIGGVALGIQKAITTGAEFIGNLFERAFPINEPQHNQR